MCGLQGSFVMMMMMVTACDDDAIDVRDKGPRERRVCKYRNGGYQRCVLKVCAFRVKGHGAF